MTDKVTVELRRDEMQALSDRVGVGEWSSYNREIVAKIDAALAAHEAAQNPLCTPWEAYKPPCCADWSVRSNSGRVLAGGLTEAQARLLAAAPELADALGCLVARQKPASGFWAEAHRALKKADR
jgi:hypothetical protein